MTDETERVPHIIVGALITHFGGVLLIKPEIDQQWQLPSALLSWRESLPNAVERIVRIQTGIGVQTGGIVQSYDLISADDDPENADHIVVLQFEAFYRNGELRAGEGVLDVAWVSAHALKTMTVEENTADLLSDLGFL